MRRRSRPASTRHSGAGGMVLAGLFLAGCAAPNAPTVAPSVTRQPSSRVSSAHAASSATVSPPSASPTPTRDGWSASGPSYGVDRATWPRTSKGAKALFDRLPRVIEGHRGTVYYGGVDTADEFGPSAVAAYGRFASVTVLQEFVDKPSAKKQVSQSAAELLSAQFGLVFGCAPHSYRGTIRSVNHGVIPGTAKPMARSSWFSCHINGAEGDEGFSGEAVGWISGPTAWQIVAADRKSLRVLLGRLHQAGS